MKPRNLASPGEPAPSLEVWSRLSPYQQYQIRLLVQLHLISNLCDRLLTLPLPVKFGALHTFFLFFIIALFPASMRLHVTIWDLGAAWIGSYCFALAFLLSAPLPQQPPIYAHWIGDVRDM